MLRTIPPTRETTGVSLYVFAWTTPVAICPAASDDGRSPTVSIFNCTVFICSGVNVSFSPPAVAGCGDSSNETERGAATGLPACFGHQSHAAITTIKISAIEVMAISQFLVCDPCDRAAPFASFWICPLVFSFILFAPFVPFCGLSSNYPPATAGSTDLIVSSTPVKPWRVRSRLARCKQQVGHQ